MLVVVLAAAEQTAVVVGEGVRLFAVNGVVADFEHLVGHAQRHAAHEFDKNHDERRPNDIPADDEERAHDLQPDLFAVASNGAAGVDESESGAAFGCSPKTCTTELVDLLAEWEGFGSN